MLKMNLLRGEKRGSLLLLAITLALSCMHNRPDAPAVPVGQDSVEPYSAFPFKTWVSGTAHGQPFMRFDWGDGDTSVWCGPGETARYSHSWRDSGVFAVRAQARDDRPELSQWSEPLRVTATVPPYPYRLLDSVTLGGSDLFDAQVLPNGELVYVTDLHRGGRLWVLRTSDLHLVTQISLRESWEFPQEIVRVMCSPNSDYVYAVPFRYRYVGVIRAADQVVVDSLIAWDEAYPLSSALSPDGTRLYVAVNGYPSFVVVFRLPDNVVEDTILTPYYVTSMQVAPDGSHLYVVDYGSGRVCSIRLSDKSVEWQVRVDGGGAPASGLVVHPSGSRLYAFEYERIAVLDAAVGSVIDAIPLPSRSVYSMEFTPDGSFISVATVDNAGDGAVAVVRTADNKVVREIAMPEPVCDAAPSPDGQRLYSPAYHDKLYVLGR